MTQSKIIIISNNVFNLSNSNGRTLGNILSGFSKENLLQFSLSGDSYSPSLISHAFYATDKTVVKSFFKKKIYCLQNSKEENGKNDFSRLKRNKTPFKCIIRNFFWKRAIKKLEFNERAKNFNPDYILLQLSDTPFLISYAEYLADLCNAKIVIFTTEDYYFKSWNYMNGGKKKLFFDSFMKIYRKTLEKTMERVNLLITNSTALEKLYHDKFGIKTDIIMPSATDFNKFDGKREKKLLYAGNLGLGRHKSILKIAEKLKNIAPDYSIEVYSNCSEEIKKDLSGASNLNFNGFIEYEKLLDLMQKVSLLIHAESFDEFYRKDLKMAFSTKIADSLASGTPLLLFAPCNFAETEYLKNNGLAFIISDENQIDRVLRDSIYDETQRNKIISSAISCVAENHDRIKNGRKALDLLQSLL